MRPSPSDRNLSKQSFAFAGQSSSQSSNSSGQRQPNNQPRMTSVTPRTTTSANYAFGANWSFDQDEYLVGALIGQLRSLNKGSLQTRLSDILNLFKSLKDAEYALTNRLYDYQFDDELHSLSIALSNFLNRFNEALRSNDAATRLDPASLSNEHIQTLCQGLAVCAPSNAPPLWTSKEDGQRLQQVTDRLVQQALKIGLPDAVQENGEVLGVLNWISRGLKSGLLTSSDNVNQLFQKSLPLIESWTGGDQCRQLLTDHNLGRCAVQINTLINHIQLDWQAMVSERPGRNETYGELLQRCILNLCSESVLKRLTSAPIDTVSLLNVCNLVKDALSTRRLSPANKSLLPALACLVGAIGRIPHKELIGSYSDCRSLSNFSNFIRTLCEYRNGKDLVFDQALPTLTATCEHLISCVNDDLFVESDPSQQALANLISFIKLCDKRLNSPVPNANAPSSTSSSDSRLASTADRGPIAVSREKYVSAAQRLVNRLIEQSHDEQASSNAIGGLLAGLSYLWQRNLVPRSPALKSYVTSLLGHAAALPSSAWQDKSRAVMLPALLGMFNSGLANEAATQSLLERLQVTGDLRTAMKALNMVEEVIDPLPVQPITVDTSISIPEAKSEQRAIPGMTKLREVPTLGMFSNSSSTTVSSTTASPIRPAAKQNPVTPDWQDAKHVTRRPATSAVLPHTAPFLIPTMTGNKKASPPKEKVDVNKVAQQKKVQPSSPSKTNKKNARSAKATNKTSSTKSTKSTQITGGKPAQTVEAAILAGDSARADLLTQQSEPWTAERIARIVDAVQAGALMYEKPIYDALKRFLDAVLKDIDSDKRYELKKYFLDNPPQIQFIATLLEEHSLIRTAHADNLIFTDSDDDITPNVEAIGEVESAQVAPPRGSHSAEKQGMDKNDSVIDILMSRTDKYGRNSLMRAAKDGLNDVANVFLEHKLAAEKQSTNVDKNGWNALMLAASGGHEKFVQRLLKIRSTTDKQTTEVNKDGHNALMLAAINDHHNIVKLLLNYAPTADNQTTSVNTAGCNALMLAAAMGNDNIVQLLLKHQPTADEQTTDVSQDSLNALMIATHHGNKDVVKSLLNHQATVDKQTTYMSRNGWNALMRAAFNGHASIVRQLLSHHTAEQQRTAILRNGQNIPMLAALNGHTDVVKVLLDHAGIQTTSTGHLELITLLRESPFIEKFYGLDLNKHFTPLIIAAFEGREDLIDGLLPIQNDVEVFEYHPEEWWNGLSAAISMGHAGVVERLLTYSSASWKEVTQGKRFGSMIDWARSLELEEIVNLLTQKAASV